MKSAQRERTTKIVLTALFSALIAVGAFLKIPVPAIPFTLQFFFANMAALFLGKKWGTLAVGIYLALGLIGVPIFTAGGGIFYVLHPTFGYLIGFLAGNFAAGLFLERVDRTKYKNLVIAGFLDAAAVYLFGLIYFYLISTLYLNNTVTVKTLLVSCFLMTFWSDTIFIFFTAFVAKKINKLLRIDYAGNLCADVSVLKRNIRKGYRVTEIDAEVLLKAPLSALCRAANNVRKCSCGNLLYFCDFSETDFEIADTPQKRVKNLIEFRDGNSAPITIRFDFLSSGAGKDNSGKPLNADEQTRLVAVCRMILPTARILADGVTETELRTLLTSGANAMTKSREIIVSMDTKTLKKLGFSGMQAV